MRRRTCGATLSLLGRSGMRVVRPMIHRRGVGDRPAPRRIIVDICFPTWPAERGWAFREFSRRVEISRLEESRFISTSIRMGSSPCCGGNDGRVIAAMRLPKVEAMICGARPTSP